MAAPSHPNAFVARVTRELAWWRRSLGVTLEGLAERLDTAPQNIQRIEAGQNITLRTLARIAAALGLRVHVTFEIDPRGWRTPPPGRKR